MGYNTDKLKLFCYDVDIDSDNIFSIEQALNDNWIIIDNAIPTKTSQLTNDSGFLTSHQSLSNYCTLNSAQTISGNKTFTGTTKVPNSATVGTAVSTAAISKAANGYVKFGNGIILQWGRSAKVTKKGQSKTVTLPTSFNSTNYKICTTWYGATDMDDIPKITAEEKSEFTIKITTLGANDSEDWSLYVNWIALGY